MWGYFTSRPDYMTYYDSYEGNVSLTYPVTSLPALKLDTGLNFPMLKKLTAKVPVVKDHVRRRRCAS